MSILWGLIGFLLVIVVIITVVDIIRHRRGRQLAAWLLIVIIVPFAGAILYWVLRKPTAQEVENARITGGEVRPPIGRSL